MVRQHYPEHRICHSPDASVSWPSRSPDLNPIRIVLDRLNEKGDLRQQSCYYAENLVYRTQKTKFIYATCGMFERVQASFQHRADACLHAFRVFVVICVKRKPPLVKNFAFQRWWNVTPRTYNLCGCLQSIIGVLKLPCKLLHIIQEHPVLARNNHCNIIFQTNVSRWPCRCVCPFCKLSEYFAKYSFILLLLRQLTTSELCNPHTKLSKASAGSTLRYQVKLTFVRNTMNGESQ